MLQDIPPQGRYIEKKERQIVVPPVLAGG